MKDSEVPQCSLCQIADDMSGMKVNSNCDKVHSLPCPSCNDHIEIEDRIQEAKKVLDNLILERSKIRTRMNESHDPLMRHLPPEVISSIFRLCLPDYWFLGEPKHLNQAQPQTRGEKEPSATGPLIFGAVCKQWREVAWASPYLWDTIRVFLDRHKGPLHITTATQWLDRAGNLPLSIYISRSDSQNQEPGDPQLISLINERSAQWENIVFLQKCNSDRMLVGSSEGAPILRTIRVTCLVSWTQGNQPTFSLIGPKPHPTHLSLDKCRISKIDIDYSALTHFFADEISLADCVELLLRAPLLKHCKVGKMQQRGHGSPTVQDPIVHTELRSLELGRFQEDEMNLPVRLPGVQMTVFLFLSMLSFPSLTHLTIEYPGENDSRYDMELAWEFLEDHIMRSSPPLIAIRFRTGLRLITSRLRSILHATPLLSELEVSWKVGQGCENEDGGAFFNLFTDPKTSPTFLPNLQSLGIFLPSDRKEEEWFWGRVLGIFEPTALSSEVQPHVQSAHKCPLRTLRVQCDAITELYESEETIRRLLALHQAGIEIDIKDGPSYAKWFTNGFQKALDIYKIGRKVGQ